MFKRWMDAFLVLAATCIVLAPAVQAVSAAPPASKPPAGERINAFALEAFKAKATLEEVAGLPLTPKDLEGPYHPFSEWPLALRKTVQRQAEESQDPDVQAWLRRPDPFADTQLRFEITPGVDIRVFETSAGKSIFHPQDTARFVEFLDSLTAQQRKELFMQGMIVRQTALDPRQRAFARSIDLGKGMMVNGVRLEDHPQARLGIRFQVNAVLQRTIEGQPRRIRLIVIHVQPNPNE